MGTGSPEGTSQDQEMHRGLNEVPQPTSGGSGNFEKSATNRVLDLQFDSISTAVFGATTAKPQLQMYSGPWPTMALISKHGKTQCSLSNHELQQAQLVGRTTVMGARPRPGNRAIEYLDHAIHERWPSFVLLCKAYPNASICPDVFVRASSSYLNRQPPGFDG